jgi:hypothetical protein
MFSNKFVAGSKDWGWGMGFGKWKVGNGLWDAGCTEPLRGGISVARGASPWKEWQNKSGFQPRKGRHVGSGKWVMGFGEWKVERG